MRPLPKFPYHRDPSASDSLRESNAACDCCGKIGGILYEGSMYALDAPENLCPWCIADGSAESKYDGVFFDAYFCDDEYNEVEMSEETHSRVFGRTIGFATYNPIGWWVHCNEPSEYVTRNEPYEMVFECTVCQKRHILEDLD